MSDRGSWRRAHPASAFPSLDEFKGGLCVAANRLVEVVAITCRRHSANRRFKGRFAWRTRHTAAASRGLCTISARAVATPSSPWAAASQSRPVRGERPAHALPTRHAHLEADLPAQRGEQRHEAFDRKVRAAAPGQPSETSTRRASALLPLPWGRPCGFFRSILSAPTPAALSALLTASARALASSSFCAASPVASV